MDSKGSKSATKKPASVSAQQSPGPKSVFPPELLDVPLAPTQPLEDEVPLNSPEQKGANKQKEEKKNTKESKEESRKLLPYPEVKPPTASQKKRRQRELEKDKKEKIASGFYQSRSDEDDTLEKVNSLKEEKTEQSRRHSIRIKLVKEKDKEGGDKKEEAKDEKVKQPA
ncbi:hypothetical protein TELCIR_12853 [Teladorsagia circumcincta]|uniref:Uncharacterized protein n=1 Tax=Teladorsagia circumcincta TaxID=45464 RepID=A0A2G9U5N7_TELCI|nr:hypothetical protein TELCIR_12853 [Teladorsagia circumcincta]